MSAAVSDERRRWHDRLPVRAGIALGLALLVNVALVVLAGTAEIAPDLRALSGPPVVFLSTVSVAGAAVAYLGVRRFVDRPDRTFRRVAVAVLLVSFVPDLVLLTGDEAATPAGVGLLMVMHVVVAAACLRFIPAGDR